MTSSARPAPRVDPEVRGFFRRLTLTRAWGHGLDAVGIRVRMLIAAAVCVAGALLSQRKAPETTRKSLPETSSAPLAAARS